MVAYGRCRCRSQWVIFFFSLEHNSYRDVTHAPMRCFSHVKDVSANCFCASLLRAQIHMPSPIERALVLKWTKIGQMAIAIALLGFNALGRSVTPNILFRIRFYLQLSLHCPKITKKSMWRGKKITISVRETSNPDIVLMQGAWNCGRAWNCAILFFEKPHQLTRFA